MSSMQVRSYLTATGTRSWRRIANGLGIAFRRIAVALVLWRSRAAARRLRAPRHIDDRLFAGIDLIRMDLRLPTIDFFIWW